MNSDQKRKALSDTVLLLERYKKSLSDLQIIINCFYIGQENEEIKNVNKSIEDMNALISDMSDAV